jgi:N-acetylmuramoyl-L-alanine amidase
MLHFFDYDSRKNFYKPSIMRFILFCLVFFFCLTTAKAAILQSANTGQHPDKIRVVLRLDNAVRYSVHRSDNQITVRLQNTDISPGFSAPKPISSLQSLSASATSGDTLVSLKLNNGVKLLRHFYLKEDFSARLVLDLSIEPKKNAATINPIATISTEKKQSKPRIKTKKIIVLDPGHGGEDPGAIGATGLYEKELTLTIAKEIQTALEKTGAYTVYLTRNDDRFIPLRQRTAIAQERNADLFISLHADAHPDRLASGSSVYTLSERASDKEAEALAAKENRADIIHGVDLSGTPDEVSTILIDLVQRETLNHSARFATLLVQKLRSEINTKRDSHRFAGFVVLKAPDTPAVLVELGFLSNKHEEWLLRQRSHRAKITRSIVKAINGFFQTATTVP